MAKEKKSVIDQLRSENQQLLKQLTVAQTARDEARKEVDGLALKLQEQEVRLEHANTRNDILCTSLSRVEAAKEAAENAYERALGIVADRLTE